jgi:hypothetical protein
MRAITATLALAAIVVLSTAQAGLAMTGEELLEHCEALLKGVKAGPNGGVFVPNEGRDCWTYVEAIQDVSTIGDERLRPLLRVCAPADSSLMQYIRIFVDHARRKPADLHKSAALVAQSALSQAFPCR